MPVLLLVTHFNTEELLLTQDRQYNSQYWFTRCWHIFHKKA